MKEFSIHDELESLDNNEMHSLMKFLLTRNPEIYKAMLEWFKQKSKHSGKSAKKQTSQGINDELLMEYWDNAYSIISEFNEYGGGPRDQEDEAFEWLDKITALAQEGNISSQAKYDFLDETFTEYDYGNSGFEDALMDIFFDLCKTKEEWIYLVKKLEKNPSNWNKDLIMQIYKDHLHDDAAYLRKRLSNLKNGSDYFELAEFYRKQKNLKEAIRTAEEGIIKAKGRLEELFVFLFSRFAALKDTANLERIVNTALERKSDEKIMLDHLSAYYRKYKDYEKAKESMLKAFEYINYSGYYDEYNKLKQYLKQPDWLKAEPRLLQTIQNNDIHDYLRICLDKNMKAFVLKTIMNPPKSKSVLFPHDNFDEFADALKHDYPNEIIEYYWNKAYQQIQYGNRPTYSLAKDYLSSVKNIYIKILHAQPQWQKRFAALKDKFSNRPAFLDVVKKL